jgi:hypothetical protein
MSYFVALIIVALVILCIFALVKGSKRYWQGRDEGWRACEGMILSRAKREGYDVDKLYKDLLQ